jgi:hypothetical protein
MAGVTGVLEARRVARLLKDAPTELKKAFRAAMREPVKPFIATVRAETLGSVPSGYGPLLARSIRATVSSGFGSGLGFTLIVSAKGKSEDRDLRRVEDGELRHPVFGRHRRTRRGRKDNPWVGQRVRGGMVGRSADKLGDDVARKIQDGVDKVARRIEGA